MWYNSYAIMITQVTMDEDLITHTDIERIAREGTKIYESVKSQYDPLYHGKFLVIDIDSKEVFFGNTSTEATLQARKKYPQKVFYLVKIGYDVVQTMAQLMEQ